MYLRSDEIKQQIRGNFNRAVNSYDEHGSIQRLISQRAILQLMHYQTQFDWIIDFGCGSGQSTQALLENISFKRCFAIDFADKLLHSAQSKLATYKNINYLHRDFERNILLAKKVELIFSNMALQWAEDFSATLNLWQSYLSNQGLLLFTLPLDNNFPELKKSHKPALLSHRQIMTILSSLPGEVISSNVESFPLKFDSQLSALKSLKATGANYNKSLTRITHLLTTKRIAELFTQPNITKLTYTIGSYLIRKQQ